MFRLVLKAPTARHAVIVDALRPFNILFCEASKTSIILGVETAEGAPEAAHDAGARVVSATTIADVPAESAEAPAVAEVPAVENAPAEEAVVVEEAPVAKAEEETPVPFCVRLSGAAPRALVDEGLALCRALSGSVEFGEPPTAWDGADWTIRGVGVVSAVSAACGALTCGAVVEAA